MFLIPLYIFFSPEEGQDPFVQWKWYTFYQWLSQQGAECPHRNFRDAMDDFEKMKVVKSETVSGGTNGKLLGGGVVVRNLDGELGNIFFTSVIFL